MTNPIKDVQDKINELVRHLMTLTANHLPESQVRDVAQHLIENAEVGVQVTDGRPIITFKTKF